jgi:glycosyltransferase involved in cell wall biosynthesis
MQQRMKIPDEKIHVVHIGVNPQSYEATSPARKNPAVGFLSRMHEENGFGLLVDAFIALKQNEAFAPVRLYATGGMTADDKPFIHKQMEKLKRANLADQVEIHQEFNQSSLKEFFRKITVLSVPVLKGEAFGLYQLEALASGVPLVQPALGAFPEIIDATGGGVIYQPNTSSALAGKLAEVFGSPALLDEMSSKGIKSIIEHFDTKKQIRKMVGIYQRILDTKR